MNAYDNENQADLEAALTTMLARREADITTAAAEPELAEAIRSDGQWRDRGPGGTWVSLVAAAVVVLLALGSLLVVRGLRADHHTPAASSPNRPAPSPRATGSTVPGPNSCSIPSSWERAITAGKVAVDQPMNQPVSGSADGSFLMQQDAVGQVNGRSDFTHQELAIFDRAGHGTTIWTAADPVHDYVDVSQDSAISSNWVVFGLTRSQNLAAHGVAAWNRTTGQLTTIRTISAAEEAANLVIDFDPIVVGDTAYWIEQKFNDAKHQTLVAQPLPGGTPTTTTVSNVARLIAVFGAVALLLDPSDPTPGHVFGVSQTLTAGPGLDLPVQLRNVSGAWFHLDSGTLRWTQGGSLYSWRPGQPTAQAQPVQHALLNPQPIGPLLISSDLMLDTRNGALLRGTANHQFVLTAGTDLIVTTGTTKFGGNSVSRVAIAALPPAPC